MKPFSPRQIRHFNHYLILLVLMLANLLALTLVTRNTISYTLIIVLVSLTHFFWGLVHQALEKELHPETILEYLLFSLLGLVLVLAVYYYL